MGMGIDGEWQTCNDSRTIRECHSPNGKGMNTAEILYTRRCIHHPNDRYKDLCELVVLCRKFCMLGGYSRRESWMSPAGVMIHTDFSRTCHCGGVNLAI